MYSKNQCIRIKAYAMPQPDCFHSRLAHESTPTAPSQDPRHLHVLTAISSSLASPSQTRTLGAERDRYVTLKKSRAWLRLNPFPPLAIPDGNDWQIF